MAIIILNKNTHKKKKDEKMSHEFTNAHATTVHINKMFGYMSSVLHVLNTDHIITAMLHADFFATQSSQVAFYSESVLNFFFFLH